VQGELRLRAILEKERIESGSFLREHVNNRKELKELSPFVDALSEQMKVLQEAYELEEQMLQAQLTHANKQLNDVQYGNTELRLLMKQINQEKIGYSLQLQKFKEEHPDLMEKRYRSLVVPLSKEMWEKANDLNNAHAKLLGQDLSIELHVKTVRDDHSRTLENLFVVYEVHQAQARIIKTLKQANSSLEKHLKLSTAPKHKKKPQIPVPTLPAKTSPTVPHAHSPSKPPATKPKKDDYLEQLKKMVQDSDL
jgi:hypothetical protein